jgi:hypothetical protein
MLDIGKGALLGNLQHPTSKLQKSSKFQAPTNAGHTLFLALEVSLKLEV